MPAVYSTFSHAGLFIALIFVSGPKSTNCGRMVGLSMGTANIIYKEVLNGGVV